MRICPFCIVRNLYNEIINENHTDTKGYVRIFRWMLICWRNIVALISRSTEDHLYYNVLYVSSLKEITCYAIRPQQKGLFISYITIITVQLSYTVNPADKELIRIIKHIFLITIASYTHIVNQFLGKSVPYKRTCLISVFLISLLYCTHLKGDCVWCWSYLLI